MGLLWKDRDYALNDAGELMDANQSQQLLGEVLFRLTVRRGSFPFLPELGSRLHLLSREKPAVWERLALQYAAEALKELEAEVTGVQVQRQADRIWLTVELAWKGQTLSVECEV